VKALACAVLLALSLGPAASTFASEPAGFAAASAAKKKCKANWAFKKGKCRRKKHARVPPFDNSPRDIVRATVTWQGNANVDLIVEDAEDRQAGYSAAAGGVVNEIPDATHLGDVGPIGGTETFIDHIWRPLYPNFVANRGFLFEACARDVVEPVTATLTYVGAIGGTYSHEEHFDPPPPPGESGATTLCGGFYA
jgi:hypothetical protein